MTQEDTKKTISNSRALIAYGRFFIANPDSVNFLRDRYPLNQHDTPIFYVPGAKGYNDYPCYQDAVKLVWGK